MLNSSPAIRMAVPTGTMVVMDSRTHHRGSENLSNKRRTALYVEITSFKWFIRFYLAWGVLNLYVLFSVV